MYITHNSPTKDLLCKMVWPKIAGERGRRLDEEHGSGEQGGEGVAVQGGGRDASPEQAWPLRNECFLFCPYFSFVSRRYHYITYWSISQEWAFPLMPILLVCIKIISIHNLLICITGMNISSVHPSLLARSLTHIEEVVVEQVDTSSTGSFKIFSKSSICPVV